MKGFILIIVLFSIYLTASANTKTHSIQIDINSPCELLHTQYENGLIGEYDSERDSYNNFMQKQCDFRYNQLLRTTLENLESCVPHRNPRQVVESVLLASRLITCVTDFVSSAKSTNSLPQSLYELGTTVYQATKQLISAGPERQALELAAISDVSESAELHKKELMYVGSRSMPGLLFASFHVAREMIAGISNLLAIANQCSHGRLATYEIAELTNNWDLTSLDPESATIVRIDVNKQDHIVEIYFQLKEVKATAPTLLYIGLSILTIILIIVIVIVYIFIKRQPEDIYGQQQPIQAVSPPVNRCHPTTQL